MRRKKLLAGVAAPAFAVLFLSGITNAVSAGSAGTPMSITVLSGRADLVSGGSALIQVNLPSPADAQNVKVVVDGQDVSTDFALRADGGFEGLVTGLALGPNVLQAYLPDGSGAQITLVDHPNGGPVFSGPQLEPWTCQSGAVDAQCDQAPTYHFVYMSTNPTKSGFQPYDVANPPSDVAATTTDQGITVPYIVRVETGYMDRDQYQVASLFQPGQRWTPFSPQRQWNHKLLILHGASCGASYTTGTAPDVTGDIAPTALGLGFLTMSTALDNSGHYCNVAVQAESLVMAKEHIVKSYGTIRYTIGHGCSGGSLAQQWIANAYPGVYQGILPTCSFPDAMSSATQVADYALLERYFLTPSLWGTGVAWSPSQWASVEGNALPVDAAVSVGCTNPSPPYTPQSCPTGYFYAAVPYFPCPGVSTQQLYNAQTNPGGVRCSIIDLNKNLLGLRGPQVWSAAEKKIGHGFAGLPIDNVGVQYGLGALREGKITPAQFVDLNAHIGGADIDINPTPNRLVADEPALGNAYRTGLINETNNLNETAIIDCRGPDPGAAHDAYRAFAVRARLDREHGTHANQLIWEGPEPILADNSCGVNSFLAMDRWLTAVEADHSGLDFSAKIVRDKPGDLTDRCYDGAGTMVSAGLCPQPVVPVYGTARMVAGDAITTDDNKCQLEPLSRSSYTYTVGGVSVPVPFTDAQWAQLQQTFPNGVCDFSKPGVDQQPTVPWLTYQDANGNVIYGGQPLGPPPVSTPIP
jgi:hypothetical protein